MDLMDDSEYHYIPDTRAAYGAFVRGVSAAIVDYTTHLGLPAPMAADRHRAADTAWRMQHPGSEFGHEGGMWPVPAPVPAPRTPGALGLLAELVRDFRKLWRP